jgi:hypothetical protein
LSLAVFCQPASAGSFTRHRHHFNIDAFFAYGETFTFNLCLSLTPPLFPKKGAGFDLDSKPNSLGGDRPNYARSSAPLNRVARLSVTPFRSTSSMKLRFMKPS